MTSSPQPIKRPTPWWKNWHIMYFPMIALISAVNVGIPWVRALTITVPSQSESKVTVGLYKSGPVKGYYGWPIVITQDDGASLILSCAAPDAKWQSSNCFKDQLQHNGSRVKVFWSEQPAVYRRVS